MPRFIILLLAVSPFAAAQSDWGMDVLIWDFPGGITTAGVGYQDYDGLYGADYSVFATAVQHRPGNPNGDLIVLRKSSNNGQNWTRQRTITTGANNHAYTPRVVFCDNGASVLLFFLFSPSGGGSVVRCYKYNAQDLSYISGSTVDASYPGMGNIRSFTVNPGCGGYYHVFMETDDNWLYESISPDGATWSPAAPVAANVRRASAAGGPGTRVAVTWYNTTQQTVTVATGNHNGMGSPVSISSAPSNASPIPVWEESGSELLGVVWHSSSNMVTLATSADNGATWSAPQTLAQGIYPFADIFPGTARVVFSHLSPSGQVYTGSALSLSQAPSMVFEQRNEYQASAEHPAVVRHGVLSTIQGLFYMSSDEEKLWFTNSLFTGIEDGAGETPPSPGSLTVTPNPSTGPALIQLEPGSSGSMVTVYSLDGRAVWSGAADHGGIHMSDNLPAGLYTVAAVRADGSTLTARMLRL